MNNILEITLQNINSDKFKEELKYFFWSNNIVSITSSNEKNHIKYVLILHREIENKDISFLKEKYIDKNIIVYKISCDNTSKYTEIVFLFLLLICLYFFWNIYYSKSISRCKDLWLFNSFNIFTNECRYYNPNWLLEFKQEIR